MKGRDLLGDLETPLVTEDDLRVFEWLEGVYKSSGREVGNRKKTKMYIALFRVHSQIDRNRLGFLINTFLQDESQMEYSRRLEYLLFKPATAFDTRFSLEGSRLYQFFLKHREQLEPLMNKLD